MRKELIYPTVVLSIVIGLYSGGLWATTEDRINGAIPLPKAVEIAKKALLDLAGSDSERAKLAAEINAKLRVRAIECSLGYSPSVFTSNATIKEHLASSTDCFDNKDEALGHWIGLRRVGYLLRMPSLRPIPATLPQNITSPDLVSNSRFAVAAGVVLFWDQRNIELLDIRDGERIARLANEPLDDLIGLSPNARVLAVSRNNEIALIDVGSGETLASMQPAVWRGFFWLSRNRALYNRAGGKQHTVTIDFDSGEERPVPTVEVLAVSAIPGSPDEFLLFSTFSVAKARLSRDTTDQHLIVLDQKSLDANATRVNGATTADGKWYISLLEGGLNLTSTATLETTRIMMAPFELQSATALPDPDLLYLKGTMRVMNRNGVPEFVYSISRKTLARVNQSPVTFLTPVFLPGIRRLGFVTGHRLTLVESLLTGAPIPLEQFQADLAEQANQYKAVQEEHLRTADARLRAASSSSGGSGIMFVPPRYGTSVTDVHDSGASVAAADATIEGIGISRASHSVRWPNGSESGVVSVEVRRGAGKPIILVLSSREALSWSVRTEPGVRLRAVLVSCPLPSQVTGADGVEVIGIGKIAAIRDATPEYEELQKEVQRRTGQHISHFQGTVEGDQFTIGGS